jgi:putative phosphoesterase
MTEREKSNRTVRIFVLADTHNHLPDKVLELAGSADEIWHLGDVCSPSLIEKLETLGKTLLVVRGNCDSNFEWPLAIDQQRSGVRFRLVHIRPTQPPANIDVLLHGHTHVPCDEVHHGVRFLNPGCVTRPNQGAPASAGVMEVSVDGKIQWRLERLR